MLEQLCNDYLSQFGKELIIQDTHSIGGGCISHGLRLVTNECEFFLKWNQHVAKDLFIKEAEGLNEMAAVENEYLKVPQALLCKEVDETPGYILMQFLTSGSSSRQDESLGRGLAVLHQKSANKFGFHHDNYCGSTRQPNEWTNDWVRFFGEKRILYLVNEIKKTRSLSSDEIDTYNQLVESLPELIGLEHTPSLIHGDLWSGNYMYTSSGPAIIDPATYYADREMEFSIMTMFGGFSERTWSAYQEVYPLEYGWQERVQLYQVYHILNHYYLFGGGYGKQAYSVAKKYL